ncbi:hypothetical protein O181_050397 [Austropuccinia psidii MF-1]|uniref:Uncharacterized protein n=1 Tax=Austropuccinia psidii MF-1 TaxID=1389203 RepID=A0A9Q3DYV9_9BASI|nr:hypothetical protein [Austropuccinia psidii MF-1]
MGICWVLLHILSLIRLSLCVPLPSLKPFRNVMQVDDRTQANVLRKRWETENAESKFNVIVNWVQPGFKKSWKDYNLPEDSMLELGEYIARPQGKESDYLLTSESEQTWKALSTKYCANSGFRPAYSDMKDWFLIYFRPKEKSLNVIFDELEWSLRRASLDQGVWWDAKRLEYWKKATRHWKLPIQVGDALKFGDPNKELQFSEQEILAIRTKLLDLLRPDVFHQKETGRSQAGSFSSDGLLLEEFWFGEDKINPPLHKERIEKILGKLDPTSNLGKNALPDHLMKMWNSQEVELSWLLNGVDPDKARIWGIMLWLGGPAPENDGRALLKYDKLTEDEKIRFRELLKEGRSTQGGRDSVRSREQAQIIGKWYRQALGEEKFNQLTEGALKVSFKEMRSQLWTSMKKIIRPLDPSWWSKLWERSRTWWRRLWQGSKKASSSAKKSELHQI